MFGNIVKKNGEIINVEISTYKFEDEFDPRVLVLANDITEKIKAEKELLISNKRFSYAVRAASEAFVGMERGYRGSLY